MKCTMLLLILVTISFNSMASETINEQVKCLLQDAPFNQFCNQELMDIQKKLSPSNGKLSKTETLVQSPKLLEGSEFKFETGFRSQNDMPDTYYLSLGYSFNDEPWGRWRIGAAVEESNGELIEISAYSSSLLWVKPFTTEKRYAFESSIGINFSVEKFSFHNAGFKRKAIDLVVGASFHYRFSSHFTWSIGTQFFSPWGASFNDELLQRTMDNVNQRDLMQLVESRDNNWRISTHLALNYLFD